MRVPRPLLVPVVAASLLALTACSGSSAGTPSSSTSSSSTSTSGASPSTATPSSSSTLPAFTILPASALATLPGVTYTAADGQDNQILNQGLNPSVAQVFGSAIARQMVYGGQEVGGVQLWRFRENVPVGAKATFLQVMVGGFANTANPTLGTLNGVPVAQVENARGSGVSALGFLSSTDLVLIWTKGTKEAQGLAVAYMAAAGITGVVGSPSPSGS